jgi:hypothetical protein
MQRFTRFTPRRRTVGGAQPSATPVDDQPPGAYRGLIASLAIAAVAVALPLAAYGRADADRASTSDPIAHGAAGNWNFESGDFTGWRTRSSGSGAWHVYADGRTPPDAADSDPIVPFNVPQPPEGKFAAATDMSGPGARILYRDVKLDRRVKLRFTLFYENHGSEFSSPPSLEFDTSEPNQQFRVDLVDPAAPVASLAATHILARIFQTAPGNRHKLGPRTISFDLSRWAGETVRIRFAQVDNRGPLRAGVDDVRLEEARR